MTLEEPPVYGVGQGMVEFNRNWVQSPDAPKPNLGATRGLGLLKVSGSDRNLKLGSRGLLLGATMYSGGKLGQSLYQNGSIKGHKWMASIFLASVILTYKAW